MVVNSLTINALICDDEYSCINEISQYLVKYCKEHNITYSYDCFNSAEDAINSNTTYNIAFLDIEIGSITGLDIAKKLKNNNKNIIIFFITSYEKYIDDAADLFALRFLQKPLDYSRFYSGLDKAIELINEDIVKFYLKDENKIIRLKSNKIIYIETLNHKTKIVTITKTYYSSKLIDEWEKDLTHTSFSRVHKIYILNMDYVSEYQRDQVKLTDGSFVPISYRKQAQFRKVFYQYLKRRK